MTKCSLLCDRLNNSGVLIGGNRNSFFYVCSGQENVPLNHRGRFIGLTWPRAEGKQTSRENMTSTCLFE